MTILGIDSGESWLSVSRFDGRYDVSDAGRVRRWRASAGVQLASPLPLVGAIDRYGYRRVLLRAGAHRENALVHALVAAAFIGPKPDGHELNHVDGNKLNNAVQNLEYVTPKENQVHAARIGLKAVGPRNAASTVDAARLRAALEVYASGAISWREAGLRAGCDPTVITRVIAGRAWRGLFPPDLLKRCRDVSSRRQRHAP